MHVIEQFETALSRKKRTSIDPEVCPVHASMTALMMILANMYPEHRPLRWEIQ